MPKARYLLVKGVEGHPILDPRQHDSLTTGSVARYVGWQFTPKLVGKNGQKVCDDVDHLLDHYTQIEQVVLDHDDFQRASKKGHLEILAMVVARTHDEATPLLAVEKNRRAEALAAKEKAVAAGAATAHLKTSDAGKGDAP